MDGNRLRSAASAVFLLTAAACGDNSGGSTEIECAGSASGPLAAGAAITASGDVGDLAGAAVAADSHVTLPAEPVTIECGEDIVPEGYVALGPAVSFGPAGAASDRPFTLTLPYKAARLPEGAGRRHVRIVARRHVGDGAPFFPALANRAIEDDDRFRSRVSFRGHELVTYQAVAPADAGQTEQRRYTYRAIAGISMGGNAALSIGLRNHERFDLIVDLGGEPGPSMKYSLGMIREFLFGGFCTAADQAAGAGNIGELCLDSQRPLLADQFEIGSSYEAMLYQDGDGVGLTLDRGLYMKASRDLSRALGNPAHYNPEDPYLPPGVPASYIELSATERCANPIVLEDFFDAEFNPDGASPVITFCDGGDSEAMGLGVFDPSLPQTDPAEVLLAVDVDGDGVRDPGEPVITNAFEPFQDVGADGVASAEESGPLGSYDPVTNPDPAGDDYHALRNPLGSEGNGHRDEGEPFDDVGLDGVAGSCQHGEDPGPQVAGCYDFGEGDGAWTISPNLARWYDSDIGVLLSRMTDAERRRVNFWFDAGIRDFLNASVSANAGFAQVVAEHQLGGGVYDQFAPLHGAANEAVYDFFAVPFDELPRNLYVRYGDPDATEDRIQGGDGRHVGNAVQLVNRVTTAFTWIDASWPDGDRSDEAGSGSIEELSFVPPSTGRETPFAIFLPPGYDKPENAARTYPVVYFLHGYGQEPQDLVVLSGIFENYMVNQSVPPEERFQTFIMVYVDGRCRPGSGQVPVPAEGDGCEQGTFYLDAPAGGPAQMETNMLELMDFIDANYRTRPEEIVEVPR